MIQQVEQRHLVSCVVTVVQQHFPEGRPIQLSSTGDDNHSKSVLVDIHPLEFWPVQVTGPIKAFVTRPKKQKITSYFIFTRNVKDFRVQSEMLYARSSWDSRGLFLIVVTIKVPSGEKLAL
jgi:hypothetical protein